MVYQIYFGDRGMSYNVLFDIEVYLNKVGVDAWRSEIHSSAFGSAFINYVNTTGKQEFASDMITDCKELEELRGWLFERADFVNTPLSSTLASQRHKKVIAHVHDKVYTFAKKYNLYVNED